jgi:hypothetical protein
LFHRNVPRQYGEREIILEQGPQTKCHEIGSGLGRLKMSSVGVRCYDTGQTTRATFQVPLLRPCLQEFFITKPHLDLARVHLRHNTQALLRSVTIQSHIYIRKRKICFLSEK